MPPNGSREGVDGAETHHLVHALDPCLRSGRAAYVLGEAPNEQPRAMSSCNDAKSISCPNAHIVFPAKVGATAAVAHITHECPMIVAHHLGPRGTIPKAQPLP